MTWHVETAIACALLGLLAGQLVPTLIARIPEPEPEPDHDEVHSRDDEAGESRDAADSEQGSDLDRLDQPGGQSRKPDSESRLPMSRGHRLQLAGHFVATIDPPVTNSMPERLGRAVCDR